jgi:DNA-binding NarL/FixJ family response regulator
MSERPVVVTFDIDRVSLTALRQAFPEWEITSADGATPESLAHAAADLLLVGPRERPAETVRLCRALRARAGRADTPLIVLVAPGEDGLASEALDAGAHSCLVMPVRSGDLTGAVARAVAGNRPGRHTLALDRPQQEDPWQDAGGEA